MSYRCIHCNKYSDLPYYTSIYVVYAATSYARTSWIYHLCTNVYGLRSARIPSSVNICILLPMYLVYLSVMCRNAQVCASKDRKLQSSTTSPPYPAWHVSYSTDVSQSINHSDTTHNCYEHTFICIKTSVFFSNHISWHWYFWRNNELNKLRRLR